MTTTRLVRHGCTMEIFRAGKRSKAGFETSIRRQQVSRPVRGGLCLPAENLGPDFWGQEWSGA